MKRLVIDLDNTITIHNNFNDYSTMEPNIAVINKIIEYKNKGFEIVINTSRNVRTFAGNIGKINAITLPKITDWLDKHKIPYDEIYVGKPWCGEDGFYVDDKAIRPSEFVELSYESIVEMIK